MHVICACPYLSARAVGRSMSEMAGKTGNPDPMEASGEKTNPGLPEAGSLVDALIEVLLDQ